MKINKKSALGKKLAIKKSRMVKVEFPFTLYININFPFIIVDVFGYKHINVIFIKLLQSSHQGNLSKQNHPQYSEGC